ncbi:MAG: hypothetical protein QM831_39920 [Kofleriaceae bacterium]
MRATYLTIGFLVAAALAAEAKPRVAVVAFDGDKDGEAQDMVTEAIGDDVMLVGPKQVNRTVDKLGLDTSSLGDKDLKKLTKELHADAIVQGSLTKQGDHQLLHFKIYVKGKKRKGFKVEYANLKSKKLREQLHDKMIERLDGDEAPAVADKKPDKEQKVDETAALTTMKKKGDDDDEAKPSHKTSDTEKKKPPAGDDDSEEKPRKKKVASADDDDGGASVHASVEPIEHGGEMRANRAGIVLDVGGSVQNRKLSFNSRSYPAAPPTYSQKPVPGVRVAADFYPLAFGNPDGVASGLGIGGMLDDTLSLSLTSPAQAGTKFAVAERRFEAGLRFRAVFGHTATSPSIILGVNYMQRQFIVDRGALMAGATIDLPDVKYQGFDPGLEFRIPITWRFSVMFGGKGIFLTNAGPIQDLTQYGQATITGGEGDLGIEVLFTKHIGLTLRGEFTQIGFKFKGNGQMTFDRDGDPTSPDVGGAADRYIGGAATIAVLY